MGYIVICNPFSLAGVLMGALLKIYLSSLPSCLFGRNR